MDDIDRKREVLHGGEVLLLANEKICSGSSTTSRDSHCVTHWHSEGPCVFIEENHISSSPLFNHLSLLSTVTGILSVERTNR
jgi:hypothetical protein